MSRISLLLLAVCFAFLALSFGEEKADSEVDVSLERRERSPARRNGEKKKGKKKPRRRGRFRNNKKKKEEALQNLVFRIKCYQILNF